jgi:hypothetical protein
MYNLLQKHPDNVFKKGVLNQLIIAAVLSPMLSQNKVVVIVDSASNHSVQFNKSQTQSAKKHYLHVHYLQYLSYGAHVIQGVLRNFPRYTPNLCNSIFSSHKLLDTKIYRVITNYCSPSRRKN